MFRLKHICSIFGIFPSHTPYSFFILELTTLKKARALCLHNMLRLILTLWITSTAACTALLPKVTFPVPAENPNLLNGPERRTPCAKCGGETSRVVDCVWRAGGCSWEAIWMHCLLCVTSCSLGSHFHCSRTNPRCCCTSSQCRDFNHLLLLPLCLCFSKHLCSTSTLRASALEGEFPS